MELKEKELERLIIIKQVETGKITQEEAGIQLGLSSRQVRRLVNRVKIGASGIKSLHKGGNRAFKQGFKEQVMDKIKEKYADFGPTFASEKLEKIEKIKVNRETLRHWMIEEGLWKGRHRKKARIHQSRERRSCFGELVQIDGSHHDWFEGRGEKCCLLVFVDDATSKIVAMGFEKGETTLGYMRLIQQHVETYGRPMAYYSDKHSIFKTTREQTIDGRLQDTQLHRALRELKIELICANSSQAKGRVERAHQTLQDRLIKELRLRGISTIEEANRYVPEYMKEYNDRFAVEAADSQNNHRPLCYEKGALRQILSVHSQRKLSKNLEFSLLGKIYQIQTKTTGYRLRHKTITICDHVDGTMEVLCDNVPLAYKKLTECPRIQEVDTKELNSIVDLIVKGDTALCLSALPTGPTAQVA